MEEDSNNSEARDYRSDMSPVCPGCWARNCLFIKCASCEIEFCKDCIPIDCGTRCECEDIVCKFCYIVCLTCGAKSCYDCNNTCLCCYSDFCDSCDDDSGVNCKDCLNE